MRVNNADVTDPPVFSMPASIDCVQTNRHGWYQNCWPTIRPLFSRSASYREPSSSQPEQNTYTPKRNPASSPCSYCSPPLNNSHTIFTCFKLENDKRNAKINAAATLDTDNNEEVFSNNDDYESNYDDNQEKEEEEKWIPCLMNKMSNHYQPVFSLKSK